jgi:nucleoside-diphosphate-sugar epimerase
MQPIRDTADPADPLGALRDKRVLVTAGAGFIGARLVRRALAMGAKVTVLGRPGGNRERLATFEDVLAYDGDILDEASVVRALEVERPDVVVHAAGLPDWRREPSLAPSMVRLHALGTTNVLEAARLAGVGRVVVVGSAGEYGDSPERLSERQVARPVDPYSVSKLAATEIALAYDRAFGLACSVVRPFVVYGPGEPKNRLLPTVFARALAGGGDVAFTPGEQVRDFVYVDDVAEGILRTAISPAARGAIVNLGTGIGTRVRDVVAHAIAVSGNTVRPDFGGLPYRPGEPPSLVSDNTEIHALLGWSPPTRIEEGLERAYEAFVEASRVD